MQANITIIENNARDNGNVARINGVNISLIDAPELTGSEKQVRWAEDIRVKMLQNMVKEQADQQFSNGLADGDDLDDWVAKANDAINAQVLPIVANKTDTKTWIDNRNNGIRAVING